MTTRSKTGILKGVAANQKLLALIGQGKARIVKNGEPTLVAITSSGAHIGIVAKQYRYLFQKCPLERGSGDGLFEGCSQTTIATRRQ